MNLLDIYQLLPTTSVGNELGQQMRIQILISGFKRFNDRKLFGIFLGRSTNCDVILADVAKMGKIVSFHFSKLIKSLRALEVVQNTENGFAVRDV